MNAAPRVLPAGPPRVRDTQACVDFALRELGPHLVLGVPLALGKPNHLVNAFYRHARQHPELQLDIFTALSLDPPRPGSGLQGRFLREFLARQFGDYPRLAYLDDLDHDTVPPNVAISEFYLRSGSRLGNAHAQRHYVSANYTHVARDMQARGVNVLVQMVGVDPDRPGCFSLSSNPDISLELAERMAGRPLLLIAQVNEALPYMGGDAEVPEAFFHMVLEGCPQPLFAVPRMPVSDADYLIGLFASALIRDGGTLQIGIGSLGDAACFFAAMRHRDNALYRGCLEAAGFGARVEPALVAACGGTEPFGKGLYAASEMFTDGFLHLYQAGVLSRRVYDHVGLQSLLNANQLGEALGPDTLEVLWRADVLPDRLQPADLEWLLRFGILRAGTTLAGEAIHAPDGESVPNRLEREENRRALALLALGERLADGALLHAAFFLGSRWMYDTLNAMDAAEREAFRMTRVSRINQLYRGEALDRVQRLNARCINTTMKLTLLGAAVSDQLANGQVVSGVGGQYNFVAMAHALDRGRSLLMLRSTREHAGRVRSNIVWEYPHATIPRHLRDIVITEYGAADLRGATDEEVVQRLLCITDSRFQERLRRQAVRHGKLDPGWRLPAHCERNLPATVREALAGHRATGVLGDFPLGSDFTAAEERLLRALGRLRSGTARPAGKLKWLARALGPAGRDAPEMADCLRRMDLHRVAAPGARLERRMLRAALRDTAP